MGVIAAAGAVEGRSRDEFRRRGRMNGGGRPCFMRRVVQSLRMPKDTVWKRGGIPCCPNCGEMATDRQGCEYCGQRFRNAVTIGELLEADRAIRDEINR